MPEINTSMNYELISGKRLCIFYALIKNCIYYELISGKRVCVFYALIRNCIYKIKKRR